MKIRNNQTFINMEIREKHRRWKSEKLDAYDCLPEKPELSICLTPIPVSNLYEKYSRFKSKHEKQRYSIRKEFKQGPPVVFFNKIQPKSSKLSMEIPNTLISRRLRTKLNKLTESPVPTDNREKAIEDLIANRKPINLPSMSTNNSPKYQNVKESCRTTCTNMPVTLNNSLRTSYAYTEDIEVPDWQKQPIRKWNPRTSKIVFPQKSKFKDNSQRLSMEDALIQKLNRNKNDIMGIIDNCQDDIASWLRESLRNR